MRKAQIGDNVRVQVKAKPAGKKDTPVFRNSSLEFEIGEPRVILGLQDAVIGMEPDQKKQVKVPPEKGFGFHDESLLKTVKRDLLPGDVEQHVGGTVDITPPDGKKSQAKLLEVSDTTVTLDLNHPLAGEDLLLDIKFLDFADTK